MSTLAKRLILLAIDMDDAAADIRSLDSAEARQHADELTEVAKTVRQWAQECEK